MRFLKSRQPPAGALLIEKAVLTLDVLTELSFPHGHDGNGHVLSGQPGLIAADVSVTCVYVALSSSDHFRRTGRIVQLIEGDRSANHIDKNGPRMSMPSGG